MKKYPKVVLVLGEVKAIHIDDAIIDHTTKRLIPKKYSPIARLYGDYYAWSEEINRLGMKAGDIEP